MSKFTFLKSSNFWTAVVLAIGGLFVGFQPELGADLVIKVFGVLAAAKAAREYFRTEPAVDAKGAVNNSNWWNYIATIVTAIVPSIPLEIFDSLQEVMAQLINGNWQGVFVALFSLATILYNLFKSKEKVPESTTKSDLNSKKSSYCLKIVKKKPIAPFG